MKNKNQENRCRKQPAPGCIFGLLEHVDLELAEGVRSRGCQYCGGGKLHRADYPRKPRGGPEHWDRRASFCCNLEGCRRRHTPPSVRYLGRKVYVLLVIVLQSALHQGLNPKRVVQWRRLLPQVDRRTLQRWVEWWREHFATGPFWKGARALFMPPLSESELPVGLCEGFGIQRLKGLLKLLRWLSPVTTFSRVGGEGVM